MRIKNITNELGGERVDVINYSDDIEEYVANALHPAKAEQITVNSANKVVTFLVTPENSRLAFGKKAQNVKLAQKLTGWKIDIKDAEILVNNGFLSIDGLKAVQVTDLEAIEGLAPETVSTILEKLAKQNGTDSSL